MMLIAHNAHNHYHHHYCWLLDTYYWRWKIGASISHTRTTNLTPNTQMLGIDGFFILTIIEHGLNYSNITKQLERWTSFIVYWLPTAIHRIKYQVNLCVLRRLTTASFYSIQTSDTRHRIVLETDINRNCEIAVWIFN